MEVIATAKIKDWRADVLVAMLGIDIVDAKALKRGATVVIEAPYENIDGAAVLIDAGAIKESV